ncbi:MAG: inorganic phosphate transporter [Vicinamibacterales bacterium]|jgi:phosphate/sulfate permease|nr:inorganic phosphate transporter [Vicinamibacterales bacterium]
MSAGDGIPAEHAGSSEGFRCDRRPSWRFGHGRHDRQTFIGVVTVALLLGGVLPALDVPWRVAAVCAATMGVGAVRRLSGVRWSLARTVVTGWILTFPTCGLIASVTALLLRCSD